MQISKRTNKHQIKQFEQQKNKHQINKTIPFNKIKESSLPYLIWQHSVPSGTPLPSLVFLNSDQNCETLSNPNPSPKKTQMRFVKREIGKKIEERVKSQTEK